MAASMQQAANVFNFIRGIFRAAPSLAELVEGETSDTLSLKSGVDIEVRPASFRTIRGVTAVAAIGDEVASWRSDDSANPDTEILRALRPALATTGGPLICISSPYAKRGDLYAAWRRHFGAGGDPRILVVQATSRVMNPTLPQSVVDRAYEQDAESASAEYGAEFRGDLAIFVSREALDAAVMRGVTVRAPIDGVRYCGFTDPSGGSADLFTLAIAHDENGKAVLDVALERKPLFSPDGVGWTRRVRSHRSAPCWDETSPTRCSAL